jgi:lipoprotein-anchoring transpeptidase ErfK/SrfK
MAMLVIVRVLTSDREAVAQVTSRRDDGSGASPRRVVVSLVDRKLAVVDEGRVLRLFDVAVGAPSSPSPVGRFTITNRLENPAYYAPGKVVAPGPANPLGTRWMGLGFKGIGIHGTDQPSSIGHARSHGCIRLRNRDVEELFSLVREGDVVELHGERTLEISSLFVPTGPGSAHEAGHARFN